MAKVVGIINRAGSKSAYPEGGGRDDNGRNRSQIVGMGSKSPEDTSHNEAIWFPNRPWRRRGDNKPLYKRGAHTKPVRNITVKLVTNYKGRHQPTNVGRIDGGNVHRNYFRLEPRAEHTRGKTGHQGYPETRKCRFTRLLFCSAEHGGGRDPQRIPRLKLLLPIV